MPDLQIRLVDVEIWHRLVSKTFSEMINGMEKQNLRDTRPLPNPHLERSFTADLEGDFLQWTDKWAREVGKLRRAVGITIGALEDDNSTIPFEEYPLSASARDVLLNAVSDILRPLEFYLMKEP